MRGLTLRAAGPANLASSALTPVEVTVRADADARDFFQQVHDLALDCVNQGGIANVQTISPPRA